MHIVAACLFPLIAAAGPVTLHAKDITLVEVVRLYTVASAGENLVMAYAPSDTLSGELEAKSWRGVLDWALDASAFTRRERDGVMLVVPKDWPAEAHSLKSSRAVGTDGVVGEGVPAKEAIDLLAQRAGYKGVTGTADLDGAITLAIRTGSWGAALSAALEALCLDAKSVDGVLHVMPGCTKPKRDGLKPIEAQVVDAADAPAQAQPVAAVRCAAIVVADGVPRFAVLATPSSRFVAKRGTLIGRQLGVVDDIRDDGVVVKEEVRDAQGKRIPLVTTLPLASVAPIRSETTTRP